MSGLLSSPWAYLLSSGLTALGQWDATNRATAGNRDVAGNAGRMLSGGTGGSIGYGGLSSPGTPLLSYDGSADISSTYQRMLDLQSGMNKDQFGDLSAYADKLRGVNKDYVDSTTNAYDQMAGNVMGAYDQGYNSLLGAAQSRYGDLVGRADQRTAQTQQMLENAGAQERKDIGQQYNANAGTIQKNLASRGLGNVATIGSSMLQGNERERADALGRLNDRLTDQKVSAYASTSGDALQTAGSASGDVLSTQGQGFANRMNTLSGIEGGRYNLASSNAGLGRDTEASIGGQMYDLSNQGRSNYANLYNTWSQNSLANNQSMWGNALNLVTGIENQYPDQSAYLGLQQSLGSGLGTQQYLDSVKRSQNSGLFGMNGSGADLLGAGFGIAGAATGNPLFMASDIMLGRALGSAF